MYKMLYDIQFAVKPPAMEAVKTKVEIPDKVLEGFGLKPKELADKGVRYFYEGKGCGKCNNTGYYGRIGILEALLVDDKVRDMIMKKTSSDIIKDYAIKELHMMTLRFNKIFSRVL